MKRFIVQFNMCVNCGSIHESDSFYCLENPPHTRSACYDHIVQTAELHLRFPETLLSPLCHSGMVAIFEGEITDHRWGDPEIEWQPEMRRHPGSLVPRPDESGERFVAHLK